MMTRLYLLKTAEKHGYPPDLGLDAAKIP